MDLGPITRELAPLKYSYPKSKLESKTLLRVRGALPSAGEHEVDLDDYLLGRSYFHHLIGLSSLRRLL
jgi:hypothetical protein